MNKKNKKIILGAFLIIIVVVGIAAIAYSNTSYEEGEGLRNYKYQPYVGTLNGVILTMYYDESTDSFKGTVYNPSFETLDGVKVEVHLYKDSASYELGPTEAKDLAPWESRAIELSAKGWDFDTWTAHPETTSSSESEEGEHEEGGDHD